MFPHHAVQLIELGLQWNPKARSSMKKMEASVLDNFKFAQLHDVPVRECVGIAGLPTCE